MKVSEYLRRYQISGKVPEEATPELAFYAGWLIGSALYSVSCNFDQAREMAIKIAEFIENQCTN